jgi:hypothetical protein
MTAISVDGPAATPARFSSFRALVLGGSLASLAAVAIGAAVEPSRALMARQDYAHALKQIEAGTRVALANCRELQDEARTICRTRARAQDRVGKAELQARYLGTAEAAGTARLARARAEYDVAKATCLARDGVARATCIASARTERARAAAEARLAI